jgi:RNA polymerase sigma factor (sigma-70 family)
MGNLRTQTLLGHLRHLVEAPSLNVPSDRELVQRFATAADEAAFEDLIRRHGSMALSVCRRVLHNDHDAEDAFQATFLTLARKAVSLRQQESVGSWLYGVAYRQALNIRAAAARRSIHEGRASPRSVADPLAEFTLREAEEALHSELSRLPEHFRAPVVLCCLEGLARDEAARQLRLPVGTLKSRLERGRQLLRARLIRRGIKLAAAFAATLLGEGLVPAGPTRALVRSTLQVVRSGVAPQAAFVLTGMGGKVGVLLLTLGVCAAGAGLLAYQQAPQLRAGVDPIPPATAPPLPGTDAGTEVRVDAHGDPLPEGALLRLGTVRFRHPGGINAVALAPKGKTLASECKGTVRLWDATTGKPGLVVPSRWGSYEAAQNMLAFSPDGRRVFFSEAGGLGALDLETGQSGVVWGVGPNTEVKAVHPSPDGSHLAVGTNEAVQILELSSGKIRWRIQNAPSAPAFQERNDRLLSHGPYSLALFAPDGKLVAVNTSDTPKTLRLLDPENGAERRRIDLGARLVRLAFSSDSGKVAVTERDNAVRVYDIATGRRLHSWTVNLTNPNENYTSAVAFSPDGSTVAAGATDNLIHRWDLRTDRELEPLRGHTWYVSGLVFSTDGCWLYSTGWDGAIRRWDTATWREQRVVPAAATGMAARSPVGSVLAWEGDAGVLHLADAATGKEVRTLPGNAAGFSRLAFSPDASVLAAGGIDMSLQLWEVASGKLLRQWSWPKGKDPAAAVDDIAFTPDGKALATASFRNHEILLWDVGTGARLAWAHHEMVRSATFSPDGRTLVSAGWDRAVRWWGLPELKPVDAVLLPAPAGRGGVSADDRLEGIARSPDGQLLATINLDGDVRVWDAGGRKIVSSFRAVRGQCNLAFSPDGQWLSTGGYDGEVAVWEVRSGQRVLKLAGHSARVFGAAFGPDSRTLLTGADDCTALVWDLRPGTETGEGTGVAALWESLGGTDAAAAYRAIWRLAGRPEESVPFLKGKLAPVKPPDGKRLRELLDALESDQFTEREAAFGELEAASQSVESDLRRELTRAPSAEKRQRLEKLLAGLGPVGTAKDARQAQAVVVLQWAGTPEAVRILEALARGAPEARLTRAAKAALERLANGQAVKR